MTQWLTKETESNPCNAINPRSFSNHRTKVLEPQGFKLVPLDQEGDLGPIIISGKGRYAVGKKGVNIHLGYNRLMWG